MTKNKKDKKNVLLIEDDHFLAKICSNHLQEEGLNVVLVSNGMDGYEAIVKMQPDIVVLDIIIPRMNGFELLKKVRAHDKVKNTKVIILSNLGQDDDIQQGKELGALQYFTKANTQLQEIVTSIKHHLQLVSADL